MNLDLDITNYKISDLEKFFKLPTNYTDSIVIEKEERKRSQILKSNEITKENKDEIVIFLNKAKQLLIKTKKEEEPIIKREIPPIVHTKQEEFIPSNLNPLEKKTTTKSLCIDTLFRENYNKTKSTDYIYKLPVYILSLIHI